MHDKNTQGVFCTSLETFSYLFDIARPKPATLPRQWIDRVDADDAPVIVNNLRLKVMGEPFAIPPPRREKPLEQIVEWRVVVSRNDKDGRVQPVDHLAGAAELPVPRALREIAGNCDQIRIKPIDPVNQRIKQLGPVPPEMQV